MKNAKLASQPVLAETAPLPAPRVLLDASGPGAQRPSQAARFALSGRLPPCHWPPCTEEPSVPCSPPAPGPARAQRCSCFFGRVILEYCRGFSVDRVSALKVCDRKAMPFLGELVLTSLKLSEPWSLVPEAGRRRMRPGPRLQGLALGFRLVGPGKAQSGSLSPGHLRPCDCLARRATRWARLTSCWSGQALGQKHDRLIPSPESRALQVATGGGGWGRSMELYKNLITVF